jgi:retron-type reverse transcriptase
VKDHRFEDLYHLICREDWIRAALEHVLSNLGSRTAGIDGITKDDLKTEADRKAFIKELRDDLKAGHFEAIPVKRAWIDKPGKQEKRPLGIPVIRDRVVQQLLRMLMEPIWGRCKIFCVNGMEERN